MRFVPSLPSTPATPDSRPVRAASASHAVKPVYPREQPVPYLVATQIRHEPPPAVTPRPVQNLPAEDRRKFCRRTQNLPVLVELRSGVERRRHNLFESGADEHVDIEA
jgi:hypothetical protein